MVSEEDTGRLGGNLVGTLDAGLVALWDVGGGYLGNRGQNIRGHVETHFGNGDRRILAERPLSRRLVAERSEGQECGTLVRRKEFLMGSRPPHS